jgi:predicted HicB family RNase H-like nuclease
MNSSNRSITFSIPEETRITLRIPADIKEQLVIHSQREKRSMNSVILIALKRYFDDRPA